MCPTLSDVAIITVKTVDNCWVIHDISKFKVIYFLENSVLEDNRYIWNASQRNQY